MENLAVFSHESFVFADTEILNLQKSSPLLCWDSNLENLYVSNENTVYGLNLLDNSVSVVLKLETILENISSSASIAGLTYLSCLESLCFGVSSGELFTVEKSFDGRYKEQLVACASSIELVEWSPSQDSIAVLTHDLKLLIMTADFDLVAELDIQSMKVSEEFISVGWGKEETQFKGSVGKKFKENTTEDAKLQGQVLNNSLISWRGDGQLFAVSFVKPDDQNRCISIFNRDGDLLHSNSNIPGIENVLAWRPSGSIISCTQRLPNKHLVWFLEKNALKHNSFDLPFAVDHIQVKLLSWSADSKVLLVWCVPTSQEISTSEFPQGVSESLLLYSSYNYHWYLKQRLNFKEERRPLAVVWDDTADCRLHIFSVGGRYDRYDFNWTVNHSQGMTADDGAYAALIDNGCLNLTSFRFSIIPPPMCTVRIDFPSSPRQVMFAPPRAESSAVACILRGPPPRGNEDFGLNPNDLCVSLTDGSFATLTYRSMDLFDLVVPTIKWECEEIRPVEDLHHWVWASSDTLFACGTEESGSRLYVVKIRSPECQQLVFTSSCVVDGTVVLAATQGAGKAIVQTKDGQLFSFNGTIAPLERSLDVFTQLTVWRDHVFGLSKRYRLYIDGHLAGDNVTSLAFHSRFFLLTTSRQKLLTCRLTDEPLRGMVTEGEVSGVHVVDRRVERGSKIVHVVAEDTRVILSLPRGNLECIQPRALTLDVLTQSLEANQFRETFDLARKQRINLNIIVDHNPTAFFENVDLFVSKINEPDWLSLFLSELRDEDVTTTMYEGHYKQPRLGVGQSKVVRVCEAVREALKKHPASDTFVLPIISSYVHTRTQAGLENALAIVKRLKQLEKDSAPKVTWKSALRHMLYLTNVDELLQTALGMYDFDLVLLVASKSDKDPKEYLAFLNELNRLDPVLQRYRIDKHLRRWKSALIHLVMAGLAVKDNANDEVVEFVKEHNLYNEALKLIAPDNARYKLLLNTYAEFLSDTHQYEEAGILYRKVGNHSEALRVHRACLLWKECIIDISNLSHSDEEKKEAYSRLSDSLRDGKFYAEAAYVQEHCLKQPGEAVALFLMACAWQDALRVSHVYQIDGLLDTICSKISDNAESLLSRISSFEESFLQKEERLRIVRSEKLVKWSSLQGAGDAGVREDCDLFSDTTSVSGSSFSSTGSTTGSSTGTGRSRSSSKNRRKHERKILSLKEGNPHEEGALVHALHLVITSAYALRDEVRSTCGALINFNFDDVARQVQESLARLLIKIEPKLKIIWPPRSTVTTEVGPNPYDEMAALDPPFQYPPNITWCQWQISLLKEDEIK